MIRVFSAVVVPLLMPFAAWAVVVWLGLVPRDLLAPAVYGACALAALSCWRFKRSRAVLPVVFAGAAYWFSTLFAGGAQMTVLAQVVYPAVALLLPLNWLLAAVSGDRGVLSRVPLTLAALAALQAAVVLFVATGAFGAYDPLHADQLQARSAELLHLRLADLPLDALTRLPQPALLVGVLCAAVLMVRSGITDAPMDAGLSVGLVCAMGSLHFAGYPVQAGAMALGAALAAAAPLAQDSYRMAFLDELTALPARRSLTADMRGLGGRYAIAMADVDHFKKFNDTYGHDTGDEVLRMVAAHLDRVGGGGRAYRYGGEEFTILFPRKTAEDAVAHLEAVREAIATAGFTVRKKPPQKAAAKSSSKGARKKPASKRAKAAPASKRVNLTISMGVAQPGDGGAGTPEAVIKAADKALYKAKKKGRNRVEKA